MAGEGGADDAGAREIGEDEARHWPGLESLPPEPPVEYPPARPFRRRRRPDPEIRMPAADPPAADATPAPEPRRWPWRVTIAAALVLLLLVPALFLLGRRQDEAARAASPTTTTTSARGGGASSSTTTSSIAGAPPTPSTPSTSSSTTSTLPPIVVPPDPPLAEAMTEVSAFVAAHRGLVFGDPIVAVRLPDAEFEQRLRELYLDDPKAIEAEGNMLKLQGLIAPDADYVKEFLATTPKLTGGYYQFATKQILLRGMPGTPVADGAKVVLAHELTHALGDQRFDFGGRRYGDPTNELRFGFDALMEGDAERIEHAWAREHGLDPSEITAGSYRDVVGSRMAVKYELGEKLVDDIVARGGQAELDKDFDDPPSTSEQVMHPEKYAEREPAAEAPDPPAEGAVAWTGVTGEYTTGQMLLTAVTDRDANRTAAGWGGDKAVIWVQRPLEGGLTCLRTSYVMDSPDDLAEMENAFALWAAKVHGRSARRRDDSLLVTVCAKVPPPPADFGRGGRSKA